MSITRIDKRQMSHEQWLGQRLEGVGSSEAAIAAGFSRFGTPYKLWLEKTKQVAPTDLSNNPYVYWGTMHEPTIANEFALRHPDWSIRRTNFMFVNDENGYNMIADVDRLVRRPGESPAILECKTASHDDDWGESGGSEIPEEYYLQVQHQMGTLGHRYDRVFLAVLIRGVDFREYIIPRDEDAIKDLALIERDFMTKVQTLTPPDPVDLDDVKLRWKTTDVAVDASPEISKIVARLRKVKRLAAKLEKVDEADRLALAQFMGDAGILNVDGKKALTYKTQEARRLDQGALTAEHPDLVDKFKKTSTSRVLRMA